MAANPPYVLAYGNITRALEKIREAATPPRFTQDFLATKLGMKGGTAKPVIPFLKRTGFLGGDGVPTDLYKRFRNTKESGAAAAEALRIGYPSLFEINEYVNDVNDGDLRGIIVQATGSEKDSQTVKAVAGSFKALKAFATNVAPDEIGDESTKEKAPPASKPDPKSDNGRRDQASLGGRQIGLSYTINLNLPAVSDVAVFDAIFRSLKEHLLK